MIFLIFRDCTYVRVAIGGNIEHQYSKDLEQYYFDNSILNILCIVPTNKLLKYF